MDPHGLGDGPVLDRIATAYSRGRLVPFIGAGMSAGDGGCSLWEGFVTGLEKAAGTAAAPTDASLVQRAARAVRKLRYSTRRALPAAVRCALAAAPVNVPPQSVILAEFEWPLVLSTNYDDVYLAAADRHRRMTIPVMRLLDKEIVAAPLELLGRSPADCQRVLAALHTPDIPILWALQGFVGGQAGELRIEDPGFLAKARQLRNELVVGHAEYRRVAAAAEHFRRAFAEVFRNRSLLFLGSGLGDPYFIDLFGEVVELYGASPAEHFAVMRRGTSDPGFLRDYLGITVVEVGTHDEVVQWLKELRRRTRRLPATTCGWTYAVGRPRPAGRLSVEQSNLPRRADQGAGIAISAGGTKKTPEIGKAGDPVLAAYGLDPDALQQVVIDGDPTSVYRFGNAPVYAVNARIHPFTEDGALRCPSSVRYRPVDPSAERRGAGGRRRRDLRLIAPATADLLEVASRDGLETVHSMLLGGGRLRAFPRSYVLQEMARGYARWLHRLPAGSPASRLTLHVPAEDVIVDLRGGRLDVEATLALAEASVWIEIEDLAGDIERLARVLPWDVPIAGVMAELDITDPHWTIDVRPRPSLNWEPWTLADIATWEEWAKRVCGTATTLGVERFGVVAGSTIRVSRSPSEAARPA